MLKELEGSGDCEGGTTRWTPQRSRSGRASAAGRVGVRSGDSDEKADAALRRIWKTVSPVSFPATAAPALTRRFYFLLAGKGASASRPAAALVRRRDVMTTLFWTSFTPGIAQAISP